MQVAFCAKQNGRTLFEVCRNANVFVRRSDVLPLLGLLGTAWMGSNCLFMSFLPADAKSCFDAVGEPYRAAETRRLMMKRGAINLVTARSFPYSTQTAAPAALELAQS
mmetsp:Transcript_28828/g.42403  ORF Transcript_28828/g.42403 Transcript_28828/m.42403 type:complete len:108 (-) Transcript_28828:686-1009(-)